MNERTSKCILLYVALISVKSRSLTASRASLMGAGLSILSLNCSLFSWHALVGAASLCSLDPYFSSSDVHSDRTLHLCKHSVDFLEAVDLKNFTLLSVACNDRELFLLVLAQALAQRLHVVVRAARGRATLLDAGNQGLLFDNKVEHTS